MTAPNPMLTMVAVPCVRCGSTAETVLRDRELQPDAVCCESENTKPAVPCYYCGTLTHSPFGRGKRLFCSLACWGDYAE